MTANLALDLGIVALLIGLAVWCIAARGIVAAVLGLVASGLMLSLAWVQLASIDVALTEAAVGSVTGVLLLGAATRLRPVTARTERRWPRSTLVWLAATLCAMVATALAGVVLSAPDPAPSSAPLAIAGLARAGLDNAVSAVLIAYRAIDTLLEVVVLLLALLGVWSLTSNRPRHGDEMPEPRGRSTPALALTARLLAPVGVLVGVYVFWAGASGPGGEFQGAAVIAAMWLIAVLAGLQSLPTVASARLSLLLAIGPVLFLGIGIAGFGWADGFLSYPAGFAKPLIVAIEAALLISIAATVGLLAVGTPNRDRSRQ